MRITKGLCFAKSSELAFVDALATIRAHRECGGEVTAVGMEVVLASRAARSSDITHATHALPGSIDSECSRPWGVAAEAASTPRSVRVQQDGCAIRVRVAEHLGFAARPELAFVDALAAGGSNSVLSMR